MTYALVKLSDNEVVHTYSGDSPPPVVVWLNGDASHAVSLGYERAGCRFVQVEYTPSSPGEFYQLTQLVKVLVGNKLVYQQIWTPIELVSVQKTLSQRIDADAEKQMEKYVSTGPHLTMIYAEKAMEARNCKAEVSPVKEDYPLLASTIGIDGKNVQEVSDTVLNAHAEWVERASSVETVRIKTKMSISAAKNVDEAEKIYADTVWPE